MSSYIKQIQTALKNAGFYAQAVDGIAGPATVKAVEDAMKCGKVTDDEVMAVVQQNVSHPELTEPTTVKPRGNGFKLSDTSLSRLKGVSPKLVQVVKRAIELSEVDFVVIEGLRSVVRQRELVKKGASQTMKSKHIEGLAVDIAPLVDGKVSWDFNYYYPLARAMARAATELGISVRWGGAWTVITNKAGTPQAWVQEYRKKGGRFMDGPHFELM